jgi:two-component system OmpR family response regulator
MSTAILLVEDDLRARTLLTDILARAGHQATAVGNGEEALQLLSTHGAGGTAFSVVISDIRLGAIDGLQVLSFARQRPTPPAVILLTGYGSIETAVAALRAGAFDYLLKPFSPADFLECVGRAIEQQAAEQRQVEAIRTITSVVDQLRSTPLGAAEHRSETAPQNDRFVRVGALTLDRYRHAATFHERPLRLTPIEYALLLCLGEMQGRVLGYADIVRRTHGYSVEDSEAQSMLKVHVHNLRQKIDPAYLINIRGTGYMLALPEREASL